MTGSVFLLQRVCCLHSSQHCTQGTKSHSLARYFPKDWYCMFQSELAELTLLVAIKKIPWFLSLVGQIGLFDNPVHFPGNVGMHPYADSLWVQRAQNPRRGWRLEDFEDREGGEQRKANAELFWIDYTLSAAAREAKGWAGSLYSSGSFTPCIWR